MSDDDPKPRQLNTLRMVSLALDECRGRPPSRQRLITLTKQYGAQLKLTTEEISAVIDTPISKILFGE